MSPTVEHGDILLVNVTDKEIRDGKVYALRLEGEVRVKRIYRNATGGITISSDNKSPRFRDELVPPDDLPRLDIIGRAIWGGGDLS